MGLSTAIDAVRSALRAELQGLGQSDLTWRGRLWLYRNGFLSSKDAIWDLTPDTVDQYLSDVESRRVRGIDSPNLDALENKLLFHLVISPTHDHLLVDIYAFVRDGTFADTARLPKIGSFEQLFERLEDGPVVAKPARAAKGDEVQIIDRQDGRLRLDGRLINRSTLYETLVTGRDRLLTEYVNQAEYAARIFPDSANTIRFLTMIDPETREPFIARAAHRFGRPSSGHVDNWSVAGLSARVDLDTGTLDRAVMNPDIDTPVEGWVENHPDTGARIEGVVVPGWEQVMTSVSDLAGTYGWLWPHVGWDVVVEDDTGTITVIEGNPQSVDTDIQAHGPLLADDRVRQFYRYHGVLSSEPDDAPPSEEKGPRSGREVLT